MLDALHESYVHGRRVRVLSECVAALIPSKARVLDVGSGDGLIACTIQTLRPDVTMEGVDVLIRPRTHIPVSQFDGQELPFPDDAFDVVMFIDVLHHTADPTVLLREAGRVAREAVLIKDHTRNGVLAGQTLLFMDRVGNERHGVAVPANYWPEQRWRDTFSELRMEITHWRGSVPLYPWWASWAFGRALHFIASLSCADLVPTKEEPLNGERT